MAIATNSCEPCKPPSIAEECSSRASILADRAISVSQEVRRRLASYSFDDCEDKKTDSPQVSYPDYFDSVRNSLNRFEYALDQIERYLYLAQI